MSLQEKIQANTLELIKSFNNLSQQELAFKSSEEIWSVLEIVEHIFIINKAVYKVIVTPALAENTENVLTELFGEQKINKLLVVNRSHKVAAPDFTKPKGFFVNATEANQNINSIIDKIVNHINANKIEQDTLTFKHVILGEMTKVDWIHFMISHTNRHIFQIEEVKANFKTNV